MRGEARGACPPSRASRVRHRAKLGVHLQALPRVNLLPGSVLLLTCCRNYGVTNSERGGCPRNTVHANETDSNHTCLCCAPALLRRGGRRSRGSGSSQQRQRQRPQGSGAAHAGPACSGLAQQEGSVPSVQRGRAGRRPVWSPAPFFGGDSLVLPEVGFSGCPQDRESLSPQHVALSSQA